MTGVLAERAANGSARRGHGRALAALRADQLGAVADTGADFAGVALR